MSEIVTILLAYRMALSYGEDGSKAVYICASQVFRTIQNPTVRSMVMQLANRKIPDAKRIQAVKRLETAMRVEDLL